MIKNPLVLAILGGIAVIGAIIANIVLWEEENANTRAEKTEQTDPAVKPAISEPSSAPLASNSKSPRLLPENSSEDGPAQPETTLNSDTKPSEKLLTDEIKAFPPQFDVVRITPDGNAVIAGRAAPNSRVTIYDNGQFIGQLDADAHGEWVFVPEKPFPPGSRQLALEMQIDGGPKVASDDVVVLVVPEPRRDIAGRKTDKPTQALALKFPKQGGASTVLQKPSGVEGASILSVDTIDYDDTGQMMVSGRGKPDTSIFIYLDNHFTGKALVDKNGGWRVRPDNHIEPGLYTLRTDQIGPDGKVQARISLPFARAAPMEEMPSEPFIIVQPGNSLWRIARKVYGSGFGYTTIYESNKDQITDPDMIFPGQVFALPSNTL